MHMIYQTHSYLCLMKGWNLGLTKSFNFSLLLPLFVSAGVQERLPAFSHPVWRWCTKHMRRDLVSPWEVRPAGVGLHLLPFPLISLHQVRSQSAITAAEINNIESAVLQRTNFNNEMEESQAGLGLKCSNECIEKRDHGQGKQEGGN